MGLLDGGNHGLLAGAAQGFIEGWRDAEDRKFKQMEFDAREKARNLQEERYQLDRDRENRRYEEEQRRKEFDKRLEARKAGLIVPPQGQDFDPGTAEYDPKFIQMKKDMRPDPLSDPYGLKAAQADKARREQEQAQKGFKLPPDKVLQVQQGAQIPKMLTDIESTLSANENVFGPIEGKARGMNPYDTKAQSIDAQMRASAQAFGRYMEGGVLRKEDEDKYRKMFPGLGDTAPVAKNKLAIVRKMLVDKQNADIEALKAQGYDVSGFSALPAAQLPGLLGGQAPIKKTSEIDWAD